MVVRDVEREDIEFISKTLHCLPIAHVDHMRPEKLGQVINSRGFRDSAWVQEHLCVTSAAEKLGQVNSSWGFRDSAWVQERICV
jgi:hypothetical protein